MIRKIAIANIHAAFCKLIAVVLLFSSTSPAFERPTPSFGDDSYPVYAMKPDKGGAGGDHYVTVFSPDCKKQEINENTKLVSSSNITISEIKAKPGCSLTAKISIPKDTRVGRLTFLLENKDKDKDLVIGTTEFEVTGLGRGPIPEGLDPQVDVMWGVMPSDIVHHNFGRQIAKHYYGIQIRIGNDSGFDLQIAGIGFKLPKGGIKNVVPTNSYRATRGTLEREQQIGLRATVINVVKSLSSLYSGFLPFWHMPNRRANANLAGEILSGPFQIGLDIVFPDTTVRQLTRLDDQTLRDGLIVKNNSQVVTLAWVPKRLLNLSKDSGMNDKEYQAGSPVDPRDPNSARAAPNRGEIKNWADDPQYVNFKLGELVIVGQQISYINRVQVISTSEGGGVTPPPSVFGVNPPSVEQGASDALLTIPGAYLDKATLTLNDPSTRQPVPGVSFSDITVDPSGHILKAKVRVEDEVEPNSYMLVVSSPGGSFERTLIISQAPPSGLSDITYVDGNPPTAKSDNQDVKIKVTGKHLNGAKIVVPAESQGKLDVKKDASGKDDATGSDEELSQTIIVLKGTPKGSYKLQVKNTNPKAVPLKNLTVNAAPAK